MAKIRHIIVILLGLLGIAACNPIIRDEYGCPPVNYSAKDYVPGQE